MTIDLDYKQAIIEGLTNPYSAKNGTSTNNRLTDRNPISNKTNDFADLANAN